MRSKIIYLSLGMILIIIGLVTALEFRTVYNPFTGKLDYYRGSNFSGENITVDFLFGNLTWISLFDYPVACPEGSAITQLDDSIICTSFGDVTNNTFDLFTQERINASRMNTTYLFIGEADGDGLFLQGVNQQICFTPDCNSYLAAGTGDVMFMVADGFTRMAWTGTGTRLHSLVYPASDRGVSVGNTTHRMSRFYVGTFLNESGVGIFTDKLILSDVNLTAWSQVNKTNSTYFSNDTWIDKYPANQSAARFEFLDVSGGSTAGTHLLTVDADASGFSARFDGTVGIRTSPTDATALGASFNNVESTAVSRFTADFIMQSSASNTAGFGHGTGVRTQAAITSTTAGMRTDIKGGDFNARLQTDTNFTSSLADMTGGKFEVDTTGSLNVGTIDTATAGHFKAEPVNGLFKTIRGIFIEAFVTTGMVTGGANTVYGLYISDLTGVPSNAVSGNIPSVVHSVFIEAMDGDNRGADMGNFVFEGGSFQTGHLVFSGLSGSHLFSNSTDSSFRISGSGLTGPDDYDLLIKDTHATFSGALNVTDNIIASNVFLPVYLFTHSNITIPVRGASLWTNVSFPLDFVGEPDWDIKLGLQHSRSDDRNHTIFINVSGIYEFNYDMDVENTGGAAAIDVAARVIYDNGTEVSGSVFEIDLAVQSEEHELSHDFLLRLEANDAIVLQFIATDADVELSTHSTFGVQPESVSITMKKIANL